MKRTLFSITMLLTMAANLPAQEPIVLKHEGWVAAVLGWLGSGAPDGAAVGCGRALAPKIQHLRVPARGHRNKEIIAGILQRGVVAFHGI